MTYILTSDRIWIQLPGEAEGRWIELRGCVIIIKEDE